MVLLLSILASACSTVGPETILRDQFDYNAAIATSTQEQLLLNLAWQFDVPSEHIGNGRTGETFRGNHFEGKPPIRVSFSSDKPEDAFITVRAHNYWFYIEQEDWQSKLVFSFLQLLLNLAETSTPGQGPVLTISN